MTTQVGNKDELKLSVIAVNGEPVWKLCAGEICVTAKSGHLVRKLLMEILDKR